MPTRSRLLGLLCISGVAMAGALPVAAQVPPADLQRQLQERDAIINDLMRRVEALERQLSTQRAPAAPPTPDRGVTPGVRAPAPAEEEEAVARALERTLVIQGGLLLPPFTYEIGPTFNYASTRTDQLDIVGDLVTPVTTRRDFLDASLVMRAGLPYGSQADVRIPFVWDSTETSSFGQSTSRQDAGLGDIEIGLSKQLLYEREWMPDLLASVRWRSTTGRADFNSTGRIGGTGLGFDALSGSLTAVKRQDPLVFLGSLSYTHFFDENRNGIEFGLGDAIGARGDAFLAASPDTSLRFGLVTDFLQKSEINGAKVAGSDRVESVFEVGVSSILTRALLADFGVGIGLTEGAPDFVVTLSLPYRF
jgi:hypothetical protein